MAIYLLLDSTIHDPEKYAAYMEAVPPLVAKHGGQYLARGGPFEVLTGDWKPDRIVLFKWPSREALRAFMSDPDYQQWKTLRESASTANNRLLIEGL